MILFAIAFIAGAPLVDIHKAIPSVVVDLQYKTSNNITQIPLYPKNATALARSELVERLIVAEKILEKRGYALTIFDAWRPWEATRRMWNVAITTKKTDFYAPAQLGSAHNRGTAVDIGLHKLADPTHIIPMPAGFDQTDPSLMVLTHESESNEHMLRDAMTRAGLVRNRRECWHYSLPYDNSFPICNGRFNAVPMLSCRK